MVEAVERESHSVEDGEEQDIQYPLYRSLAISHCSCPIGLPAVHFDHSISQLSDAAGTSSMCKTSAACEQAKGP
jgi:hypothetical protein